jgi:hypothetical protein
MKRRAPPSSLPFQVPAGRLPRAGARGEANDEWRGISAVAVPGQCFSLSASGFELCVPAFAAYL